MNNHPTQFLLRLTQTATVERAISIIRKDRPSRPGTSTTYTLRYTIRETENRTLF